MQSETKFLTAFSYGFTYENTEECRVLDYNPLLLWDVSVERIASIFNIEEESK
jgi:hypothetical protein